LICFRALDSQNYCLEAELGRLEAAAGRADFKRLRERCERLMERIKASPDDGGLWSGPKIARWLAKFHGMQSVHDQRGWDALIAIGYSIQQPRPRHPDAATDAPRSKKARGCG
jgi:hypothetical protein